MPYYFFIWTPEIVEHLAEHEVTPEEFEAVVSNPDYEDVSRSTSNPLAFGSTSDGRYLCCVYRRIDEDTIEPITAYEVEE
jgi:hypothetical protein